MKKTGSKKIAERYVNAAFSVAEQASSLAVVEKDLGSLATLIRENADFRAFLNNPLLTRNAQSEIAVALLKNIGAHTVTTQFVALLARHKRLDILSEIIEIFLEKAALSRGEIAAELVTAKAVSAKESSAIADSLSKTYNRKINLSTRVDPSLLGGTIINIGSVQLDGSLAGKLNRLKQVLKAA